MGAATGTPEISWYTANPTAETFEIYNADQLAGMALLLSKTSPMDVNGFSGKTIRLMDDIDLSAYQSSSMLINGAVISGGSVNDYDGEGKAEADWFMASTWGSSGLNWSTEVWNMEEGKLPLQKVFDAAPSVSVINIHTQPEAITNVNVGNISGTLSVGASVSPEGTLTYQWYENTVDSNVGGAPIPGATSPSFAIPTDLTEGTYYYFCEVSASGASAVRSSVARVNVGAPDETPPVPGGSGIISIQSYNAVYPKVTLTWTMATDDISDPTKLKYYVYRSEADNIRTVEECEANGTLQNVGGNANISTLSPGWPGYTDPYYYNVIVEDEAGNRAAYQPVVRNGIQIVKQSPKSVNLAMDHTQYTMTVSAISDPEEPISYQWYYNTVDNYGSDSRELPGATGENYTLPNNQSLGVHYFYCKVSLKGGSIWAYSDRFIVKVFSIASPPTISGPLEKTLEVGYTDTVTDAYNLGGTMPITVTKISGHEKITWDESSNRLKIAAGLPVGTYPVVLEASNPSSTKNTLTFTLKVIDPVTAIAIDTPPAKNVFREGDPLDLTGLKVKVDYYDGSTEIVAFEDFASKGITTSPQNGSILASGTSKVTITMKGKSVDQEIKVKYHQAPPSKPELENKTATSVTLKTIGGAEYRIGTEGGWQNSPVFTGLTPNTTYTFYAFYPETDTHAASLASEGLEVTTDKALLSGEVTVEGTAKFGETLTVNTSNLTSNPAVVSMGNLSYEWKRTGSDQVIGTDSSYTLTEEDIGKTVTVAVTAEECDGAVTASSAVVEKADGPSIPAITGSYTGNGVTFTYTIDPIANGGYSKDGIHWQDSNEFTGFTIDSPPTTFYAHVKETATHKEGPAASIGPVTFTKLENAQIPVLDYDVTEDSSHGTKTITITPVEHAEYKFGDDPWSDTFSKGGYLGGETVTIQIRYKETGTHQASQANSINVNLAKGNQEAPPAFNLTYTYHQETGLFTVIIPEVPGAEYSFDGINFDHTRTKTAAPGTTVTAYMRMKATQSHNESPAVAASVPLPVMATSIQVSGMGGKNSITTKGGTLQMVAEVLPVGASQGVTWSIVSGTGATLSPSGLVQATGNGVIMVRATATDGSGVYGEMEVTILGQEESSPNASRDDRSEPATRIVSRKQGLQTIKVMIPFHATLGKDGTASAIIADRMIGNTITRTRNDATKEGKTIPGISVELKGTIPQGTTALKVTLSRHDLTSLVNAGVSSLDITGFPVELRLDLRALREILRQSNGEITITFTPVKELSQRAKALIGTRPAYDITISTLKNGKTVIISSFKEGQATLLIHYPLGQQENPGYLYGVYVDSKGKATLIDSSVYQADTEKMLIATDHLSIYGVGYGTTKSNFTDIESHWAKDAIAYVVARGWMTGTTQTTFEPNAPITRGELVAALGKLSGVDVRKYKTSSFKDVKAESPILPYIQWAYKANIIQGVGNGQFAPDQPVTRQEMALILFNYAKATGFNLPMLRTEVTYGDQNSIGRAYQEAVKAMQQAGIMMEYINNKLYPKTMATRGEFAALLTRYIQRTIAPDTPLGWVINDSGQRMYFEEGKAVTGWKEIGAKSYYFDAYGVMVAGKWLQIEGKRYYFYSDGTLARSPRWMAKVDG